MVQIKGDALRIIFKDHFGSLYFGGLQYVVLSHEEQLTLLKVIIDICGRVMSAIQAEVFKMYFGINEEGRAYTPAEIASEVGFSKDSKAEAKVKKIQDEAIALLRRSDFTKQIQPLIEGKPRLNQNGQSIETISEIVLEAVEC